MAPQNESNKESGTKDTQGETNNVRQTDNTGVNLESTQFEPEPYSYEDPYRSSRITSLISETEALLAPIQGQGTGFDSASDKQLRNIHEDAIERQEWSQTRQDGFTSILRLGRNTPSRSKRVL